MNGLTAAYIIVAILLGVYHFRLFGLGIKSQLTKWESPSPLEGTDLPTVTLQLPLYNERAMAPRLLKAVCTLDYPLACLQIQVLDDSTDPVTSDLLRQEVTYWQKQGVPINYYNRGNTKGYKSGNLAFGFEQAHGEFIAIFDADFIPKPECLRQCLAHFEQADDLGLVQMRWGHLNGHESWLTLAETLTVDFLSLSQAVRTQMGLWSSFYGSAGVWRRACIEGIGGWSTETLTEDLDLAYRAQLAGWRLGYDHSLLAAAEVPSRLYDYKRQQFRWARGNLQVTKQLLPKLVTRDISAIVTADALLFGTWPVSHLLIILMLVLRLLLLGTYSTSWLYMIDILVALSTLSSLLPVMVNGKLTLPIHVILSTGLSFNNTCGMFMGLIGKGLGSFHATPKGQRQQKTIPLHWSTWGELVLGAAALVGLVFAIVSRQWLLLPLFGLHALGYGFVTFYSLWEFVVNRLPSMRSR